MSAQRGAPGSLRRPARLAPGGASSVSSAKACAPAGLGAGGPSRESCPRRPEPPRLRAESHVHRRDAEAGAAQPAARSPSAAWGPGPALGGEWSPRRPEQHTIESLKTRVDLFGAWAEGRDAPQRRPPAPGRQSRRRRAGGGERGGPRPSPDASGLLRELGPRSREPASRQRQGSSPRREIPAGRSGEAQGGHADFRE